MKKTWKFTFKKTWKYHGILSVRKTGNPVIRWQEGSKIKTTSVRFDNITLIPKSQIKIQSKFTQKISIQNFKHIKRKQIKFSMVFSLVFVKVVGPAIWYLYETARFHGNYAMLKEGDKPNVNNLWILDDNSLTGVKKVWNFLILKFDKTTFITFSFIFCINISSWINVWATLADLYSVTNFKRQKLDRLIFEISPFQKKMSILDEFVSIKKTFKVLKYTDRSRWLCQPTSWAAESGLYSG